MGREPHDRDWGWPMIANSEGIRLVYDDGRPEPPPSFYDTFEPGHDWSAANDAAKGPRQGNRTAAGAELVPSLVAVTLADFLAREIAPREMVLDPIIPRQGLAMIHAWRGMGKTYLALGIAYAVATGSKFLRWTAPKPRKVLFLDGEMPATVLQQRLAALVAEQEKKPPEQDYLRIVTPDLQPEPLPNLACPEGRAAVETLIAEGCDLLVIDNLSTLCRTGGENEADAWEEMQAWLLDLRRRGVSVLLVHHSNKSGAQRGTSRREDILDTVITLRRPQDYESEEGARFKVILEKARGIVGEDAKGFEAKLETAEDGSIIWTTRDMDDAILAEVRDMLEEGMSIREIAKELGISKSTVGRLKKKIEAAT